MYRRKVRRTFIHLKSTLSRGSVEKVRRGGAVFSELKQRGLRGVATLPSALCAQRAEPLRPTAASASAAADEEALRKILERNQELYRYEETEIGDFEGVLGDYLKGDLNFSQVLKEAQS